MNCRETFAECEGHEPYAHRLYVGDVQIEGRSYACTEPFAEPCLSTPPDAYAWPGGYTTIYYHFDEYGRNDGDPLCAKCAGKLRDTRKFEGTPIEIKFWRDCGTKNVIVFDSYDEGPTKECSDCGCEIKSSYGDPDEEKDEPSE